MDIKAVFLDIDGTFFDHETNTVLPSSIEACRLLRKNGYKIVLCSGRPKEMAQDLHVFDLFDWDGYIGCTGGVVMDEAYEVIHEDNFTKEQLTQIFTIGKQHDVTLYSFGKHEFVTQELNVLSKRLMEEFHLPMPEIRDWNGESLHAVSVLSENEEEFALFEHIEGLKFISSSYYSKDFIRSDVNKANGIKHMMAYWGFHDRAYVAFGDSENDIEMLEHASIGIAMENGNAKLKEVADRVCGMSSEPTIFETLKELKLI